MKYSINTIAIILILFLIAQIVGLAVNNYYYSNELPYGLKPPEVQEGFSPMFFLGAILVVTALFFIIQKIRFELFTKIWFFFAFVIGISITLSAFIDPVISIFVAAAITLLKFNEHDLITHNLGEILLYGGIVAMFIPILNIITASILLVIMAVYDFIAVFITKHMVGLAKIQEKMGIFTGLIVAYKNEVAILGGGDIAFTLLFAGVALRDFGSLAALLSVYGATMGILVLILIGQKKKFYPALPFITAGCFLGFALSLLI